MIVEANDQAELAVIGGILNHPDETLVQVMAELRPEDFQNALTRELYEASVRVYRKGNVVDPLTLLNEARMDRDTCKKVCVTASAASVTLANYAEYIRMVKETSVLIRAERQANELLESVYSLDIDASRERASDVMRTLTEQNDVEAVTAEEGYLNFYAEMQHLKEYIKTGFARLDGYTYVSRGDYVVIGGRPSAGKTALTLQIAMNMARERNVIYFSLETKPDKLYHRLLSCYAGLSLTAIKQQRLTAADWQRVADESDFCKLKLQVISAAGWTVDQIQAAAMARGAEVVFIDYLGLVKGRGKDLYERVTNISMDLHTMAQRQNIAVIALSQLSRQGKDKADVTSLRDSGQIEQDADVILLLDNLDEDRRKLAVAKNKEGRLGSIDLHFDGDHQRFSEITDIDPPPVYRRNR